MAGPHEEGEEEEEGGNAPVHLIDYVMRDPLLFGDFRNATNESEPRFYEDLLDYDAIFHLFTEVRKPCHYLSINYVTNI